MEELKNFELNNKVLDNFDKVMEYHLDKVETLTIKEVFTNSKLFNIISFSIYIIKTKVFGWFFFLFFMFTF